jgi:hypothetical protein
MICAWYVCDLSARRDQLGRIHTVVRNVVIRTVQGVLSSLEDGLRQELISGLDEAVAEDGEALAIHGGPACLVVHMFATLSTCDEHMKKGSEEFV